MHSCQDKTNEKIMKVLKKMDEVLNRHGIYQYQDRISKIHKILLSIQRHSESSVSNFSTEKYADRECNKI